MLVFPNRGSTVQYSDYPFIPHSAQGSVEEAIIKVVKARRDAGARIADAATATGTDQAAAQVAAQVGGRYRLC